MDAAAASPAASPEARSSTGTQMSSVTPGHTVLSKPSVS